MPTKQADQKPQQVTDNSSENKRTEFTELHLSLRQHLEQAYTLSQQLQSFSWKQFEGLTWTLKDENGQEQHVAMVDMLPPAETAMSLLAQYDKCNALAVKLWMDDLYRESNEQGDGYLTRAQWQVQQQLVIEMGKAKAKTAELRSATDNNFADADKSLSLAGLKYKRLAELFQSDHASYATMLNDALDNLDQAEQLSLKLNPLRIDPNALNLP